MKIVESLKARRSYYEIKKELPVTMGEVNQMIRELTELVPDAFNMKSSRVVVVEGEMQDTLWDTIYDVFEGKFQEKRSIVSLMGQGQSFISMIAQL